MNRPLRRRQILLGGSGFALTLMGLSACQPRQLRIATLSGLTGAASDLGVTARDGALLAFEMRAELGLERLPALELLEFDDAQTPQALDEVAQRIAAAGVAAVVGPVTSSVAERWIPLAQAQGLLSISPTVTSHDFSGLDDLFFRVVASTREYAHGAAEYAVTQRGWKRWAIIRDDSNAAYSRSWVDFFAKRAHALGAAVAEPIVYQRPIDATAMQTLLQRALAQQPQALALVTNANDAASLAQLLRQVPHPGQAPALLAAEWASTDQLILRGGRAVEGMVVSQYYNRASQTPEYLRFAERLRARFGRAPGFAEVAAFDAMHVLLQALAQQRSGEALKDTLMRVRRFSGLQDPIVFDAYGDHARPQVITDVHEARFRVLQA